VIGLTKKQKSELDKKIYDVILKKRELYQKEYSNKITPKQYEKQQRELDDEHRELNKLKIEEIKKDMEEREKEIAEKQKKVIEDLEKIKGPRKKRAMKQKPVVIKKKIIKNVKTKKKKEVYHTEESYARLIIKALSHPAVDTEDKVIAIVNEWKPGAHTNDLKKYIKNIIAQIKRGVRKGLSWDSEKYKVNTSCQMKL